MSAHLASFGASVVDGSKEGGGARATFPAVPPARSGKSKAEKRAHFDAIAVERDKWRARNPYYYADLDALLRFLIPEGASVLEIGSGTGHLLASLKPSRGLGVDFSEGMVRV